MTHKNRGILTVVSGFSGAGKGTLMKELLARFPKQYALSISATTRTPREGERDGIEYFFKTREQFEQMIEENALIEYAQYVGNYYGTPKAYVEEQLDAGRDVVLEIEMQGALKIKEKYPDTLLLFVTPPSAAELKRRLVDRGTETMDKIVSRLARAVEEADYMDSYDYLIVNDNLEECVKELHNVIHQQHYKVSFCQDIIAQMKRELKEL